MVLTTGTQAPFAASYSSSSPFSSSSRHVPLCRSKCIRGSDSKAAVCASAEALSAAVGREAVDVESAIVQERETGRQWLNVKSTETMTS